MPLVFVHGVANRAGTDYDAGAATRDALFRQFLLQGHSRSDGAPIQIVNPYWGELGGKLHWNGASLPLEEFQALGAHDAALVELDAGAAPARDLGSEAADEPILAVARRSLVEAVDLLWSASAITSGQQPDSQARETDAAELAALAAPVHAYAATNPHPGWLSAVHSDQEFLTRLEREVDAARTAIPGVQDAPAGPPPNEWEGLGIGSAWQVLRRGADRLARAVVSMVGREASDRLRPAVVPSLSRFLGDVFVYLHQQSDAAGPIRDLVGAAIRTAAAAATDTDPLVVVAHSMGGNITYDLLSRELSDVPVPVLVTAGTQVGFFEELKLFRSSDPGIPAPGTAQKVPRPDNIGRWVNIFDYSDVLGFEIGSVIDGVEDYSYQTGSLLKAHSQYFLQPSFHERLAARVVALR